MVLLMFYVQVIRGDMLDRLDAYYLHQPLPANKMGKHNTLKRKKNTMGRRDILTSSIWKTFMVNMMKLIYTLLGLTLTWLVIQIKS